MGLDISLVQFKSYRSTVPGDDGAAHSQVLISVSQLYPVRDVEEFTISPERHQARELRGQLWDETRFLDATHARLPESQVAFIQELLDDVQAHDGSLGWGRSPSAPGVSGRYSVGGAETMVWRINVGTGLLELRIWYVAKRLEPLGDLARLETAAQALTKIPKAAAKIADARKKEWKTSLYLPLTDILPSYGDDVIAAIHAVIDPFPAPE